MASDEKKRIRKKRLVRYFSVLFLVVIATLFLWKPLLGHILKKVVTQQVCTSMDADCVVDEIRVSMLPPAVEVEGLQVKTDQGPLRYLGVETLRIVPGIGPAFLGRLVIKRAEVDGIRVALRISETKPQPQTQSLPESLNLPLRDLIQVELGRLIVNKIQMSVEWPAQNLKLSLDEGKLAFRGKAKREVLTWDGSADVIRGGQQIKVPKVQLRIERKDEEIRIRNFSLEGEQSEIQLGGIVYPDLSVKWKFDSELAGLQKVLEELNFVERGMESRGSIELSGLLKGTLSKWDINGKVSGSDVSISGHELGALQGTFKADASRLLELEMQMKQGKTNLEAEYQAGANASKNSTFRVSGILPYTRVENLYQDPGDETHLVGDINLEVEGEITPEKEVNASYEMSIPELRLELDDLLRPFLPLQFSSIQLDGKMSRSSENVFEIQEGTLEADGFQGAYSFRFDDQRSFGEWSGEINDAGKVFAPDYQIRGNGKVGGGIDISDKKDEILLTIELPELGLRSYPAASFTGDIAFVGDATELRTFILKNEETRVTLEAAFDVGEEERSTLKADFSNLSLGWASKVAARKYPIVERVEGRSSGFLELAGTGEELTGRLEVESDPILIKEEAFDRAEIALDFLKDGLEVKPSKVFRKNASISFSGMIREEDFEDFAVNVEMVPLSFFSFPEATEHWMTHIQGDVKLNGDSANPNVSGSARIFRQSEEVEFSSVGTLKIMGPFNKLGFQVDYLGRKLLAEGEVNAESGENFLVKGFLQEFPLTPYLEDASTLLSGQFSLQGNASEWTTLLGSLRIEDLVARTGDWEVRSKEPSEMSLKEGRLRLSTLLMEGAETEFSLNGESDSSGLISGGISGRLELRILQFLSREFKRAEGLAKINARFGGTIEAPEVNGQLDVSRGQLLLDVFPTVFENINLNVTLAGRRAIVSSGRASVGGGDLKISGDIILPSSESPMEFRLEGETTRVRLRYPDFMPSTTSGSIQVTGPVSKPLLSGQFTVHRAVYRANWDWKSKILSIRGAGRMERIFRSDEESLELDLEFTSEGDSLEILNNLARGKLSGNLRLVGTDQEFGLLGRLELQSGRVEFLDNEFDMESGSISFEREDTIEPIFDLNANTRVEDILILLDIRSEGDTIQAYLSSEPARDETSIIALLTLGVDVDDLTEGSAGGSSLSGSILPSVLSGPVQSQLESGLKKAKLIDSLQFVPYYSEDTNTSGMRLIVGKQLFPKVRLLYSTDLFDVGAENTLRVEQRLNDNVSLQGSVRDNKEQAEEDFDLGVDFEFRLDF